MHQPLHFEKHVLVICDCPPGKIWKRQKVTIVDKIVFNSVVLNTHEQPEQCHVMSYLKHLC